MMSPYDAQAVLMCTGVFFLVANIMCWMPPEPYWERDKYPINIAIFLITGIIMYGTWMSPL